MVHASHTHRKEIRTEAKNMKEMFMNPVLVYFTQILIPIPNLKSKVSDNFSTELDAMKQ